MYIEGGVRWIGSHVYSCLNLYHTFSVFYQRSLYRKRHLCWIVLPGSRKQHWQWAESLVLVLSLSLSLSRCREQSMDKWTENRSNMKQQNMLVSYSDGAEQLNTNNNCGNLIWHWNIMQGEARCTSRVSCWTATWWTARVPDSRSFACKRWSKPWTNHNTPLDPLDTTQVSTSLVDHPAVSLTLVSLGLLKHREWFRHGDMIGQARGSTSPGGSCEANLCFPSQNVFECRQPVAVWHAHTIQFPSLASTAVLICTQFVFAIVTV